MIQLFKRLRAKKSYSSAYSCSEDHEMEEKETKSVESTAIIFPHCVDHQSSVIFAKDLKKRSDETSTVNPFESLNILSKGRLKMKEYSDGQERESDSKAQESVPRTGKPGQQSMIWNDAFQDNYSSKKLPEEHPEPENIDGKDNNTTESMCASHAKDGCDSKSEEKQSKGDSKCVKSSDCTKRNECASGRHTIHSQSSSGSSSGNGDEDEDESDENRRRRRNEEKFDDLMAIDSEEENNEETTRQTQDQQPSSNDQELPAEGKDVGVSAKDQEVLAKDQEVSAKDQEAPANDQEVPIKDQEATAKDQEAPAKEQDVLAKDQEVSAKVQEVPVKDQEASAKGQEVPAKDQEVSAKEVPAKDQEVSAKDHDQEVPAKDQEATAKDQEASAKEQEVLAKDQEVSAKGQEVPAKDQEVSAKEVPAKDQEVSAKDHDQEVPAKDQEMSVKSQEAPVKDGKSPAKDQKAGMNDREVQAIEKRSYNLVAAFKCHGEKSGSIDRCKKYICYGSHCLLDHSRKCLFRVLGGCKKCKELLDIYLHHTSHCNIDKCVVTQCCSIKEYLKENSGQCQKRWSYKADRIFFGDRVIDTKSQNILQDNETRQPVTKEEIEELLLSLQPCSNSINSTQIQYSLPEDNFRTRQPRTCESVYMYHPRRPPDDREESVNNGVQDKAPFSVAETEEEVETETVLSPSEGTGIHARGVSIRIEAEVAEICVQEAETGAATDKDERSFPRPDDVKILHPLDKKKLNVKDGRYDENHEWRIVHKKNFLGRGAFGVVRLCVDLSSIDHFAAKIIQEDKFDSTELEIWAGVSGHSLRCLDLLGAVCVENMVIMFMEYMEGGSVENMLSFLRENRFDEYSALYILREVLEGLDFLHCRRIIHGDIKGGNILVNSTLTKVKIADYGAAVQLDKHESFRQENRPPGTENFMAPEVCRSEKHSFSSDVWSTGCFMYQMLEGQPPWTEYSSVIYKVGTTKEPPIFPKCSEATTDLLDKMFILKPQDRPTVKELERHHAFEEVNGPPEVPSLETEVPSLDEPEHDQEHVHGHDEHVHEQEEGDKEDNELSSEDEFYSFEEEDDEEEGSLGEENEQPVEHHPSLGILDQTEQSAYNSSSTEVGEPGQHHGSLNQSPSPLTGGERPVFGVPDFGGPGLHLVSLNQSPSQLASGESTVFGEPEFGGPGLHLGSLNQSPSPLTGGESTVFGEPEFGGPGQHLGSLNQSPPPLTGGESTVFGEPEFGGPGLHLGSLNQSPSQLASGESTVFGEPEFGGPGLHLGSLNQSPSPLTGGESTVFGEPEFGGPGLHLGSLNQSPSPLTGGERNVFGEPEFGGPGLHLGSLNQSPSPLTGGERNVFGEPELGGPGQHLGSLNQSPSPLTGGERNVFGEPEFGGPGLHLGSLNQSPSPLTGGESNVFGEPEFGGPGQHLGSLNQSPSPLTGGERTVFGEPELGGPGQHLGSLNQSPSPLTGGERPVFGEPEFGGPGVHLGSLNKSPSPLTGGERPMRFREFELGVPALGGHVLGGHHERTDSSGHPPPSTSGCNEQSLNNSGTFPVDDELERLQSDFLTMLSLDGGDVSDFIGMVSRTTDEEQDDVFDDVFFRSFAEASQESEAIYSPGRTYSMQDLTRVDLYDANGSLLFTVREKASCTFGNLAENLHTKILEKSHALKCFTFTSNEVNTASVDPNQELGFQDHVVFVLPATDRDEWGDWRIDNTGIVELRQQ